MTHDRADSDRPFGGGLRSTLTGKLVVAHPTRVAQADQVAAKEQIESVLLREHVPTTHVYVLDLDKMLALPEEGFFRV